MRNRLQAIKESKDTKGKAPREAIAAQNAVREELKQLQEDWNTLNALYQKEKQKKKVAHHSP
jgi:hypothetical protein